MAALWPDISRKLAQRVIAAGGCYLDGHRCHVPATPVWTDARLRVCVDPERPFTRFHLHSDDVLYQDSQLLVVRKPSGTPVNLSATGQEGSIQKGVKEYLDAGGLAHPAAVIHRLDSHTSGLVLFGKDPETEKYLYRLFREGAIRKMYLALVSPAPVDPEGTIRTNIAKRVDRRNQYAVSRTRGKAAVTRYAVRVKVGDGTQALLAVWPETGRPHQIRVHLAWVGCPVVGDVLYGGPAAPALFGLHAFRLVFPHPATGRPLRLTAPLPDSWLQRFPELAAMNFPEE